MDGKELFPSGYGIQIEATSPMQIPTIDHNKIYCCSVGPIRYYFMNYRNLYHILDADRRTNSAGAHFQQDIYSLGKYLNSLVVNVHNFACTLFLVCTDYCT
jgi:hypothetical protein